MLPLFDDNPHRRPPVLVGLLIAANLGVFGYELLLQRGGELTAFIATWGLIPAALGPEAEPETWATPFTAMFLHGGWAHVLGNCWFLWIFGNNIEDRLGMVRFALFYVVCGAAAAAAQVAAGPHSLLPMIGASGAISGVLGAYMRFFPRAPVYTLVPLWFAPILPVPAFVFIFVWFLFQVWQGVGDILATRMEGGVAWWAHVGGFLAGVLLAGVLRPRRR